MENVTWKSSLCGNVMGFSGTLPLQKADPVSEHCSSHCTQWNNTSLKEVSTKALFWSSWLVTEGYGSLSSPTQLHLHTDGSDWPDGFLQNVFIGIVPKHFLVVQLIFCKRPADGSLSLPRSSPRPLSWTSCYTVCSYWCWYLTVKI